MNLDRLHRRLLAVCIHVGKEPTKENMLKNALKMYLKGYYKGLCSAMHASINFYNSHRDIPTDCVTTKNFCIKVFPLFNIFTAEKFDGYPHRIFWWPLDNWKSRYKYMMWLIKQYR